jgi:coenzyme PQQ precursor peptide PqqA
MRLASVQTRRAYDSKFEHQRADELDVVVLVAGGGDVGKVVLETGLQAEFSGRRRFHANFGVHQEGAGQKLLALLKKILLEIVAVSDKVLTMNWIKPDFEEFTICMEVTAYVSEGD